MNFPFIIFNSRWDVYGSYFLRSLYINFVMDSFPFICRSVKPPTRRSMLPTVSVGGCCCSGKIWMQMLRWGHMISLSFIGTCSKYRFRWGVMTTPSTPPESIRRRLVGRCGLLATQFPHFCHHGAPSSCMIQLEVTCSTSATGGFYWLIS